MKKAETIGGLRIVQERIAALSSRLRNRLTSYPPPDRPPANPVRRGGWLKSGTHREKSLMALTSQPLTARHLSRRARLTPAQVSRALDILAREGLVMKTHSEIVDGLPLYRRAGE